MNIRFVYPDMTSGEFSETLESLNMDIDNNNNLSAIPRLIAFAFGFVSFIFTAILLFLSWKLVIFLITGRDAATVYVGIIISVLLVPASLSLQRGLAPLLKRWLLKVLGLKDYEERFTVLEHAERNDKTKQLSGDLQYYNLCDELRRHKIDDATVNYDGNICEVDVSYMDGMTGTQIVRKIRLPLIVSAKAYDVTVDLERRCVVFPAEKGV